MKVVFVSSFFNHHQKSFCDAMYSLLGKDFAYIETTKASEERKKLGWGISEVPEYVVPYVALCSLKEKCQKLICDSDVVIFGSAKRELLEERLRAKKTIFFYSERPLKGKFEWWKYPVRLFTWRKLNPQRKNIFMLCASAYTATDYGKFGLYKKRAYKWGYFPETKTYDDINELLDSKEDASIIWVGRFISWKHPETAINLAKRLKQDGKKFKLNMIGIGHLEDEMKVLVEKNDLSDCVTLLGSMKPEKVREYMEKSKIFIFTSDKGEGWGAVLNEAMNSACACVAGSEIGSAPYLIKNGENGYLYKNGDFEDFYFKVASLLDDEDKRKIFGKKAYTTIRDTWNAEMAAKRFLGLCENIENKKKYNPYNDGPCSEARSIRRTEYEPQQDIKK